MTRSPIRLPAVTRAGDTPLWNSASVKGLVVAASGCELADDQALSARLAMLLRAAFKQGHA